MGGGIKARIKDLLAIIGDLISIYKKGPVYATRPLSPIKIIQGNPALDNSNITEGPTTGGIGNSVEQDPHSGYPNGRRYAISGPCSKYGYQGHPDLERWGLTDGLEGGDSLYQYIDLGKERRCAIYGPSPFNASGNRRHSVLDNSKTAKESMCGCSLVERNYDTRCVEQDPCYRHLIPEKQRRFAVSGTSCPGIPSSVGEFDATCTPSTDHKQDPCYEYFSPQTTPDSEAARQSSLTLPRRCASTHSDDSTVVQAEQSHEGQWMGRWYSSSTKAVFHEKFPGQSVCTDSPNLATPVSSFCDSLGTITPDDFGLQTGGVVVRYLGQNRGGSEQRGICCEMWEDHRRKPIRNSDCRCITIIQHD